MGKKWGVSGGTGNSRPVENPVGTLGLTGSLSVVIVALLAVFDVDIEVEVVAAVLGGLNSILAAVVFRQPPRKPPTPPTE